MRTPQVIYSVRRDYRGTCWEVVRRIFGQRGTEIVQTNIRTRDKAEVACAEWQKRHDEAIN